MPGIVGLITRMPPGQAVSELARMVDPLRHENFYVTGTWKDASLGIYVGWIARKDSFSDGMPLQNESGDIVLVFSGEEFSVPKRVSRIKREQRQLSQSAASYLIDCYQDDPCFPAGLNGKFHGVAINRAHGTITLFNDRYGMRRVYYHESKEAFYFAAEAKAILSVRPELRKLDPRGLGEFVSCGTVLEDRTLFDGIHVLPGGSAWVFRKNGIARKATYFQVEEWENQTHLSVEPYYQKLKEVFRRKLPLYFTGHERSGMSLTGGLDSRMIMAWHKSAPDSLPCYTFGGMFRDCRDVVVARQVAHECKQSHEVIAVGEDFLSRFSHYAERTVFLTDGCSEVVHSPDLYSHERAREIAPVRMTGNYGGEILRKVRMFRPVEPKAGIFCQELLACVRRAGETYAEFQRLNPLSFAIFRKLSWHFYGQLALAESQLSLRSPYLDNDLVQTVLRGPESVFESHDLCFRLVADGNPVLPQIPLDREQGRTGLIASCERQTHKFLFKAEYAYDSGMPQWFARIDYLLSPFHFERFFLGRHKFYHFRLWYRDALSKYVQEILLDPRTLSRPFLERGKIETIVRGHIKGNRNYTSEIHKVLSLELLHRLFIDRS